MLKEMGMKALRLEMSDRVCRMESAGTLLALAVFGGMKLFFGD